MADHGYARQTPAWHPSAVASIHQLQLLLKQILAIEQATRTCQILSTMYPRAAGPVPRAHGQAAEGELWIDPDGQNSPAPCHSFAFA